MLGDAKKPSLFSPALSCPCRKAVVCGARIRFQALGRQLSRFPRNSQFPHLTYKRRSVQPESRGCAVPSANNPIGFSKSRYDVGSIRIRECARAGDRHSFSREFRNGRSQFHTALRQNDRSLYEILQFPDIARPIISHESRHHISRNTPNRFSLAAFGCTEEVIYKQRNIICSFAQRREIDRKYIQSIVQIDAKPSFTYHLLKILVCRRHYAHIDLSCLRTPKPLELLLLNRSQELGLKFERQFANFV